MRTKVMAALFVVGIISAPACETMNPFGKPAQASLRTDSAEVSVLHNDFTYSARIGFAYTNTTAKPVSMAVCSAPSPELEKKIDGKWVAAYSPVSLACRRIPDFTIASGATYHGVLNFTAFEPGHNYMPTLDVSSIDGVYRLRFDVTEGTDATRHGARRVNATSNEFRMVERGR